MKKQIRNGRKGITMIELLVVATIVLSLMVISVPVIKPMIQSQATSNAASVVSTYLNRARTRAMTTGRPCGVIFETWSGAEVSLILRQVEMPPLYSGLTDSARVDVMPFLENVLDINGNTITDVNGNIVQAAKKADLAFTEIIPYNIMESRIRFDGSGPFYKLTINGNNTNLGIIDSLPGIVLPEKRNSTFSLYLPAKPTMTAPVGLPQGTVVDLQMSGIDGKNTYGFFYDDKTYDANNNIVTYTIQSRPSIVFGASGEVIAVSGQPVNDTVYMLIGRWEKIPDLILPDEVPNYEDANNFWVTINPTTGVVSTTEVNPVIDKSIDSDNSLNNDQKTMKKLYQSREFARMSKRNLGGH